MSDEEKKRSKRKRCNGWDEPKEEEEVKAEAEAVVS
jgi:hypothetical protein